MEFSHKLIDNVQYLVKSNACTVFLSKLSLAKRFVHDLLVPDMICMIRKSRVLCSFGVHFPFKIGGGQMLPHIRVGAFDQVQQLVHLVRAEPCVASAL